MSGAVDVVSAVLAQAIDADAFFADPVRARSPEHDFGVWWRAAESPPSLWRVSWIADTGELYAIELNGGARTPQVVTIGRTEPRKRWAVERMLAGWEDVIYEPGSLAWAIERGGGS